MKEEAIRKYAGLMKELGLTGLEVKEDGYELRLEYGNKGVKAPETYVIPETKEVEKPATEAKKEEGIVISSPMVGVFYAASAENAEPFVHVGSNVKKGDTLCLIEAMKLMNEITAEEDGTILEIYASNGSIVEFGAPLFRIGR
ncbi:MAG: acetyl-CoA carboxylase, biotin carboxyl carrier protein [Spirochaetes bacterium]|uniref:Biotin carboxyl carrier protein of acetyl-CoA carboxylase n=1 Tax=Candidatus Ornithospirochaeta stercoripullorum TaxID=2840899 RepID=A0A9D9DYB6_9SPIO|nr:acetyl-CoA carboxylase, biotin carboxyl carrier protein [Candidatus Ornithospirochaeta stercoripullorum]